LVVLDDVEFVAPASEYDDIELDVVDEDESMYDLSDAANLFSRFRQRTMNE
jgi:hypothetical protein